MKELHELRPAPRRAPSPVLWLIAVVIVSGSGLLISTLPTQSPQPLGLMASATRYSPKTTPVQAPAAAASAMAQPSFGSLDGP